MRLKIAAQIISLVENYDIIYILKSLKHKIPSEYKFTYSIEGIEKFIDLSRLEAINPCIVEKHARLTVGKMYRLYERGYKYGNRDMIMVIDDWGDDHFFFVDKLHKDFKII